MQYFYAKDYIYIYIYALQLIKTIIILQFSQKNNNEMTSKKISSIPN